MRTYTSLWFASLLASATAWLLACTSLPPRLFWPGLLLPAVSLAALSGAAKFAFFGARVCENKLWFDPADAAAPQANVTLSGDDRTSTSVPTPALLSAPKTAAASNVAWPMV